MVAMFGFTGTQRGMTEAQLKAFKSMMDPNDEDVSSFAFHSGDCIGADEQARDACEYFGYRLIGHPPSNPSKRAFGAFHETREPKPYLERNRDIVDETSILIAAPGEMEEQLRSGTWSTVRYARKKGRKIIFLYPNGDVKAEFGHGES